ncbi:BRO family protein [Desulfovibrio sp.]|uniref:BRO-N domain-containing protein n=1 Tax=Desulfovibrio sp. TaxID=885 RepID=UPI003079D27C
MTTALTFNDVTLSPITYQNSPWIRSVELARALGYSSEKSVSNIYNRNQDEFSNDMSVVINLSTTDNPAPSRIFSLRGCHLVAMFARTPVAKAFRRWVLDVLDKLDAEQHAASSSPTPDDFTGTLSITPSTTEDRKPLRALVGSWAQVSGLPFAACWNQLKAAFNLANIKELPQEWIPDAIDWVQKRIDALPAPAPATALPASPSSPTDDAEGHLAAIREHIRQIHRHEESLFLLARKALPAVRKPGDMFSPARRTGLTAFQSMEDCAGALDYSLRALESAARTMLTLGR